MSESKGNDFFTSLPAISRFDAVMNDTAYRPLPDDWLIATSDIVGSTKSIEAGRYKAVNMAGASVISAILNALGDHHHYPFVFGGDGAAVAVPRAAEAATRQALAQVRTWVSEELGLTLRAALVPLQAIREAGHDVRVARLQVSPEVSYAMFTGGGMSWAERGMKAERFAVPAAEAGSRPDLSGLSCRWNPVQSRHGEILSIIVVPGKDGATPEFETLIRKVVALTQGEEREGHPLAAEGPETSFVPGNTEYETRAAGGNRILKKLGIISQVWLVAILDRLNMKLGRFDAKLYRSDVAASSDFRKFDDGLKMTVDLDPARSREIEAVLKEHEARGICRFGLHRQDTALMTCLVPTPLQRDHMHFIDGGAGGYARAASVMKAGA